MTLKEVELYSELPRALGEGTLDDSEGGRAIL